MNRNARILQRSFAFEEPTERLAEASDSDDRVQAAINQAIHGNGNSRDYSVFYFKYWQVNASAASEN
jgi:hypothetical protein